MLKSKSNNNKKGTPPLTGRALTNDLCGQNVKVNFFISALAKTALILTLTLILIFKYWPH